MKFLWLSKGPRYNRTPNASHSSIMRPSTSLLHLSLATGIALSCALPSLALAQSIDTPFSDIPKDSPILPAAEYMKAKGILTPAAQFKPNDKLTRAQAAKILVAPIVSPDQLAQVKQTTFTDVPAGAWYLPYVEAAKQLGIVSPAAMFNGDKPVTKAAFIKMLLISRKLDASSAFSDFTYPLSTDVANPSEWYYPLLRYALASSMTAVGKDGNLSPARELTRGDMALLYYRLEMYMADRRTQALLSQTETDIGNVLQMLDAKNVEQAEYASNRAIISARGALTSKPNDLLIQGAVKVAKGFQLLVQGYRAGISGNLDGVIAASKEAYAAADKAKSLSPGLSAVTMQMQAIAKTMADDARAAKAAPKQ